MTKTREERIAEWLECEYESITEISEDGPDTYSCWINDQCEPVELNGEPITYKPLIAEWLASEKGEVAMMDRLQELLLRIEFWVSYEQKGWIYCGIYNNPFKALKDRTIYLVEKAPTRNEALQEAILQMLGKGE